MRAGEFRIALAQEHAEKVEGGLRALQRAVSLQVLTGVVLKTPVDTGRARANWTVTLGGTSSATTEATDPSGGAAISAGSSEIAQVQTAPLGESVFIQNNLPYIERLEAGASKQSPGGMVAVTVAEVAGQFS